MRIRPIRFLYNLDRALASLFGAPAEETISSEIGRNKDKNPIAKAADDVLDDMQKNHCENAEKHATALDKAEEDYQMNQ